MTTQDVALLLSALGLGAILNSVVKALSDRRKLGADTTSILTSAARELVEPLRKELAAERAERVAEHQEHVQELAAERAQVTQLKRDLDVALDECRTLRRGLAAAHDELTRLRARLEQS